jgi:hypothetical protein
VKYTIEMASDGVTDIPNFMKIFLGIQVILRLLPRQSEDLQCWYCSWEGFMMYGIEMCQVALYIYQV